MRLRGHGWRHGAEMAAGMLLPWAAVLVLVGLGAARALPWLAQADTAAMLLGMLGVMLVRRDHYTHGGAHHRPAARGARRFRLRPVLLAAAYATAVVLVPTAVGLFDVGSRHAAQQTPPPGPALATALPPLPVPDPSKRLAVVLSSAYGTEITDTLPNVE